MGQLAVTVNLDTEFDVIILRLFSTFEFSLKILRLLNFKVYTYLILLNTSPSDVIRRNVLFKKKKINKLIYDFKKRLTWQ